ncbi:hypothetical protein HMPREF9103_00581 [Lentilactobacillus parafarraginis F0439]|uniref:Uncharacterized protein n=1 Tax=Lentilactobacillus parafarraginis F0439 TaxID=797515 RepID=G9ZLI3_9LACO|nr:hypothetical protein HMPREF9103_00581 [Lentilactobacillus parafarraginis F0439]
MSKKTFTISQSTKVVAADFRNPVLKNAAMILQRDVSKVTTTKGADNQIDLTIAADAPVEEDDFQVSLVSPEKVCITARTALGVMYGALAVSREILKVDDFWYFMDILPQSYPTIEWTNFDLHLPDYSTKYRAWFINDELLIMGWKDHDSQTYVWQRIFETALRVGCNVVVPGTDKNSQLNRNPAKEFGLMIAHHHAEPLGAKIFARVYPNLTASFTKYPDLFRKLWRDAILAEGYPNDLQFRLSWRGR